MRARKRRKRIKWPTKYKYFFKHKGTKSDITSFHIKQVPVGTNVQSEIPLKVFILWTDSRSLARSYTHTHMHTHSMKTHFICITTFVRLCRHFYTPVGSQITLIFFVYCEFLLSLFYVLLRFTPSPNPCSPFHFSSLCSHTHYTIVSRNLRCECETKLKRKIMFEQLQLKCSGPFVRIRYSFIRHLQILQDNSCVCVRARIVFRLYAYKLFVYLCCASTFIHSNK